MEKLVNKGWWGRVDEFEIVYEFPAGYRVWNIGRENFPFEGYIPLAKPDSNRRFSIIQSNMKALKCASEEEALYILKRASRGDYQGDEITQSVFNQLINEYYENNRKEQAQRVQRLVRKRS